MARVDPARANQQVGMPWSLGWGQWTRQGGGGRGGEEGVQFIVAVTTIKLLLPSNHGVSVYHAIQKDIAGKKHVVFNVV